MHVYICNQVCMYIQYVIYTWAFSLGMLNKQSVPVVAIGCQATGRCEGGASLLKQFGVGIERWGIGVCNGKQPFNDNDRIFYDMI